VTSDTSRAAVRTVGIMRATVRNEVGRRA